MPFTGKKRSGSSNDFSSGAADSLSRSVAAILTATSRVTTTYRVASKLMPAFDSLPPGVSSANGTASSAVQPSGLSRTAERQGIFQFSTSCRPFV